MAETLEVETEDFFSGKIDLDKIKYPIITKAISSTIDNWKADSFVCNNALELKEAFGKIRSKKVLIQQYIKKKNELCLDGCSWNKGKNTLISIASTYDYILPDTYSPLMTVKSFHDEDLKIKLERMFEIIGFEGIFSIEFLVGENDELFFLEINFRNSTWSYASTVAGMPLPIIWLKGMMGENENCYREIDKPFKAIVEFDDFRNRVRKGIPYKIGAIQWLREFRKTLCTYYWSPSDQAPFWSVIFNKFQRRN